MADYTRALPNILLVMADQMTPFMLQTCHGAVPARTTAGVGRSRGALQHRLHLKPYLCTRPVEPHDRAQRFAHRLLRQQRSLSQFRANLCALPDQSGI